MERQSLVRALMSTLLFAGAAVAGLAQTVAAPKAAPTKRPAAGTAAPKLSTPSSPAAGKPLLAEEVYRNIQILRGMPVDQFLDTMGFISGALGTNCIHCHDERIGSADASRHKAFEIETPNMLTARKMILMARSINRDHFAGARAVTCYTCHNGSDDPPPVIPDMRAQYSVPNFGEPDEIRGQDPNSLVPQELFDRYVQAVGGAARWGNIKTIVAKGTYAGYDTDLTDVPMDLHEKFPGMRTRVMHTPFGARSEVFDGNSGWTAVPDSSAPRPVLDVTGGRKINTGVLAALAFPVQTPTALSNWRTGPPLTISSSEPGAQDAEDREVDEVQGYNSARLPVKLYFAKDSGLLVRMVSYINTAIGLIPAQIDYSDFRDVDGVKLPFRWVETWTDGQSIYKLNSVSFNAPIEDSIFAKPAPPKPLTPPVAKR